MAEWCVVVLGTSIPSFAALLLVTGSISISVSTTSVFVLFVLFSELPNPLYFFLFPSFSRVGSVSKAYPKDTQNFFAKMGGYLSAISATLRLTNHAPQSDQLATLAVILLPRQPSHSLRLGGGVWLATDGGSWNNNPQNCRSADRNRNNPDNRNTNIGFRVVAVLV